MEKNVVSPGAAGGERSSTGAAPEIKRWSAVYPAISSGVSMYL